MDRVNMHNILADVIIKEMIEVAVIMNKVFHFGEGHHKDSDLAIDNFDRHLDAMMQDKELALKVLSEVMSLDADKACLIAPCAMKSETRSRAALKIDVDKARSTAASFAWGWDILVEEAMAVLEDVQKRSGYVGFCAKTSLEQYRGTFPKGRIKPPSWWPKPE